MAEEQHEIGPARLAEAPAIAVFSRRIVEQGLPWSWTPQRVARAIGNPDVEVAVVRDGGRVIAFAIMQFGLDAAHLLLFGVDPEFQGRGVGRQLLQWLEKMARTAGLRTVYLEVRSQNQVARRFYRALGYLELDFKRGFYCGVEDAVLMASDMLPLRAL